MCDTSHLINTLVSIIFLYRDRNQWGKVYIPLVLCVWHLASDKYTALRHIPVLRKEPVGARFTYLWFPVCDTWHLINALVSVIFLYRDRNRWGKVSGLCPLFRPWSSFCWIWNKYFIEMCCNHQIDRYALHDTHLPSVLCITFLIMICILAQTKLSCQDE